MERPLRCIVRPRTRDNLTIDKHSLLLNTHGLRRQGGNALENRHACRKIAASARQLGCGAGKSCQDDAANA
jgi:hypothetical protein